MKVMVTGQEGQLARSLAERAVGYPGLTIVPISRPELDFEYPEHIPAIVSRIAPDVIINAAAYTAVDKAEDEADRAALINSEAPAILATAARETGARIIHISTDYVFDGLSKSAYDEQSVTNPIGVYGRTKLDGEKKVRSANADHMIVRTAWIYSPFGTNFLKTMMSLARNRDELAVVDDQHGNPSSALDLADGILEVVADWRRGSKKGLGQTYHLAGSGSTTWFEFAQLIMQQSSRLGLPAARVRPIATSEYPTRAQRPANSRLDCSKFAKDFNFRMPDWKSSAKTVIERLAEEHSQG